MTATELQRIAARLSNSCWCRHWLNINDHHSGVLMAIQCRDMNVTVPVPELEKLGFRLGRSVPFGRNFYTIPRTNEDGTPFVSQIF